MATYNKYNTFVDDVAGKVHDLKGTAGATADTCKAALSNTAPNASTHTVLADITEIAAGNGYTAGGASAANSGVSSTGTFTITGTNITWTASGGTIGPFRYVIFYNSTPGAGPLIAWWDYGSSITLNDGDTFTIKFNGGAATGTVFTLT